MLRRGRYYIIIIAGKLGNQNVWQFADKRRLGGINLAIAAHDFGGF